VETGAAAGEENAGRGLKLSKQVPEEAHPFARI
jgi:hypothetical protein